MPILLFILILSLLVFVHEYGHFAAARRSGIAVEEFGFGFPPRLFGWKRGSTIFSLNAIPFGGFVRMQGENLDEQQRPDSFVSASAPKKFLVLAAGVIMNYLLAWALFSTVLGIGITVDATTVPAGLGPVTNVKNQALVTTGSAAETAGLRSGDTITTIDGREVGTTEDIVAYASEKNFAPLTLGVTAASGTTSTITVTPTPDGTDRPKYGFGVQKVGDLRLPWYQAPVGGAQMTGFVTKETFLGFGRLIRDLVVDQKVAADLTGPVGIAVLTGQVSKLGVTSMLQFIALLSVSLAVLNFLPIPALDGGRAAFLLIETVRRKPLNRSIENSIHTVGFYLLLALILVISVRDIQRFDIVERLVQLFS